MGGMRTTVHSSRQNANGVHRPEHLDEEGTQKEKNVIVFGENGPVEGVTCNKNEEIFFERHYRRALDRQNAKHLKRGQKARMMDMDTFRRNAKFAPEEDIYQIGSRQDGDVGGRMLLEIALKQFKWEQEQYPLVVTLEVAAHLEDGAWHIHRRKSWVGRDSAGDETPDQGGALELMGVPRWDEDAYQRDMSAAKAALDDDDSGIDEDERKKEYKKRVKTINRYNNRKMTYTAACREHFQELCREYGLEIITEPREKGKAGRSQAEFITGQLKQDIQDLEEKKEDLEVEVAALKMSRMSIKGDIRKLEEKAKKILDSAENEAKKIMDNAEIEAKKLRSDAKEEGYQEGYTAGYQVGVNEGAASPAGRMHALDRAAKQKAQTTELTDEQKRQNAIRDGIGRL